ncbi:MAG: hypothetical protein EPO02_13340 [Nitrospirae bacterium]|nr:MAG: hypothetical protein EPO02_13340 [Nitrospirota bacterium]
MATNVAGEGARIFPWQVKHYFQRGGPNDPVAQSTGGPPVTGAGILSWNSTVTLPPIPGTQTPPAIPLPRTQTMLTPGAVHTAATGTLTSNTGGIYVGTIPGGSWIQNVELYCYTAPTFGGTTPFDSVGLFYANANASGAAPGFQPATLWTIGTRQTVAAGTVYVPGVATFSATNAITAASGATRNILTAYQVGPGTGTAGSTQLASLGPPQGEGFGGLTQGAAALASGDIDLYFCAFATGATSSANATMTAGSFSFLVEFTGHEG